jgi:quercetin dioxygenase-like cupin family protein
VTTSQQQQHVVRSDQGERSQVMGLGARVLLDGAATRGAFALVEHTLAPRALGAPTHTHEREDECSYVIEGRLGVEVGGEVHVAGPGDVVVKPRGVPHAFWNAGDEPARFLEIVSPPGFERYFADFAPFVPPQAADVDGAGAAAVQARYGMTMDFASIGRLGAAHGLAGPDA